LCGVFATCGDDAPGADGINWNDQTSGTLTVSNNTGKDMVLFQGQTPSANNILGGIYANSTKTFDVSGAVSDFAVGGYMILRGMSLDEYTANKANLSLARVEYSAMATYGQDKKFRTEISSSYVGDYYFKAINGGRVGIELRKDSPEGEKIGYLPALAVNYNIYASSSSSLTIFPVYVFYSSISKTVTTIKPTSFGATASVGPRPLNDSSVSTVRFPNDESIQWNQLVDAIAYPVAFIKVLNNVANQDCRLASASKVFFAHNGYDSVNSGENNTFEIAGSDSGLSMNLNLTFYGGSVIIPVKQSDATPFIKNGFDYTVTVTYNGGGWDTISAYEAVLTEGAKRDVSSELSSL
jgi:hypothetical protein